MRRTPPHLGSLLLVPTLALAAAPTLAASPDPPPLVRVWAGTRLELHAERRLDEAGAAWRETSGRLLSDLGEPIAGATLRFERDGAVVEAVTGPEGGFEALLREVPPGGAPWVARFPGGERLRPTSAVVPSAGPAGSGTPWLVFVPLVLLAVVGLAALATPPIRRALARLGDALRRALAARKRRRPSGDAVGATGGPAGRRLRVLDALRHRPIPGVRLEACGPDTAVLAEDDGAGTLRVPDACGPARVTGRGYVPRTLPPPRPGPGDAEAETLRLLRGRDAVVARLEALRGEQAGEARSGRETVLQMAGRVVGPHEAERLARICYGPARAPVGPDRAAIDGLWSRATAMDRPDETPAGGGDAEVIAEALAAEAG